MHPSSSGHHWLLDLSGCACPVGWLERVEPLQERCVDACLSAGMKVVGERFHQFNPAGVTGVVLLAESHLAVHTWPDLGFVALDIYVCDHTCSNAAKGERLVGAMQRWLRPVDVSIRQLLRASVRSTRMASA